MDPLSQGTLGAIVAQSAGKSREMRWATLLGFVAGMLADLDILIQSKSDPLLTLDYHRHFSHSIFFVPIGGLIASIIAWPFFKKRLSFKRLYLYNTLGYGTAGFLDACTSYGTHLLWPLSNARIAWDNISIIDPLFTFPLLAFVITAYMKKQRRWAQFGVLFALFYLSLGIVQRERALTALQDLAEQRGHQIERVTVKPSFANLILWRGIYEAEGMFYVDAVRVGANSSAKIYEGASIERIVAATIYPELDKQSQLYADILRFKHFSNDYLAFHPDHPDVIGDVRYATLPQTVKPLWGITIDLNKPNEHVDFRHYRQLSDAAWASFWRMLRGD